jgi:large-conductance mechanosensitive channel
LATAVDVTVAVTVGVLLTVAVGLFVAVLVGVLVAVLVAVLIGVPVAVAVGGTGVAVGAGLVGFLAGQPKDPKMAQPSKINNAMNFFITNSSKIYFLFQNLKCDVKNKNQKQKRLPGKRATLYPTSNRQANENV